MISQILFKVMRFFFPPGKSGKTMAIESKWSRQCLLPSKDPTADEVEIA